MADSLSVSDLLRFVVQIAGRIAIPPERLAEIVTANKKMIAAYNLCDGTRTQTQIQRAEGLDSGNFTRTVARWIHEGVVSKIADTSGKEVRLLHLYHLPTAGSAKSKGRSK